MHRENSYTTRVWSQSTQSAPMSSPRDDDDIIDVIATLGYVT
jgi:hypothetical protein